MKRLVFSIRDIKADTFGQPFLQHTTGAALRMFQDVVNKPDSDNLIYQHPEDFELYQLGTFDDANGMFETGVPSQVAHGSAVAIQKPEEPRLRAVN